MTPLEILEDVKSRFMVLLLDDEDVLKRYLKRALEKYQDKAGIILEAWQEEPVFNMPPHYRAVAGACDTNRRYIPWRYGTDIDENGETVKIIQLTPPRRAIAPFCLYYFADLKGWPDKEDLPGDCTSLIADYLEALLSVQNYERLQNLYLTTGMHDNVQNIPSQQDLRQRITEIENAMEENKSIIPPASSF